MDEINRITGEIINAAIRIHTRLGPGLLESVYETLLAREIARKGYRVERQKAISFDFEGLWFENAGRADIVVDKRVVVEVEAVAQLAAAHERQLMTYLRLLEVRVGLLAGALEDPSPQASNRFSTASTWSMSASVWSALTWNRISSSPFGTTG
jgi:GxxExxY protein